MRLSKKNLLLILGTILVISIVIIFSNPKLNGFAVKEYNGVHVPGIKSGGEQIYLYNKYSNNSGVILSAPSYISCTWKPDNQDDGWKECEVIFEIDDKTNAKKILNSPDIALNFKEEEDIKNIEVSYSQNFKLVEETYSKQTRDIVTEKSRKKNLNSITGMAIMKQKDKDDSKITRREERIRNIEEEISNSKERKKIVVNNKDIKFTKREFFDFSSTPIIESMPSEKSIAITPKGSDESKEFINESKNKTKDFILKINTSIEEPESNLSIIGNVIKKIKSKEDISLSTAKPFAIKITFEIPKYSSNNFNFSISDKDFAATIDPGISECSSGPLNESNSVYSLVESVQSAGTCFNVSAENITIDCQGYSIRYNMVGGPVYGIYSSSASTSIRNCTIISGDLNEQEGGGIYLSNAVNAKIEDNKIIIDDDKQYAILLEGNTGSSIYNNILDISKAGSYGIYMSNSTNSEIEDNQINSSGYSEAIYIDSSTKTSVTENILIISGNQESALHMISSENSNIINNTITTDTESQYGIHIEESTDSEITNNIVTTSGTNSHGIYLETFTKGKVSENNITTMADSAYALFITSGTSKNNFSKNTIHASGIESYGIGISAESDLNKFSENNIVIYGDSSSGISAYESNSNIFENNNLETTGEESYGLWAYDSTKTNIYENTINTSGIDASALVIDLSQDSVIGENTLITYGADSYGIEIDSSSDSNIFNSNQINTSGERAHGMFFLINSDNNSFSNSIVETSGSNSYSIYIWGSGNNLEFSDGNFNSQKDLFVREETTTGIWNFTNTPLTKNWTTESAGTLNIMWNLDILSIYVNGDYVSNANIGILDNTNTEIFSGLTDDEGKISKQIITEYTQINPTDITYYSNYLVSASKSEETLNQSINITKDKEISFTFQNPVEEVYTTSSGGGSSSKKITEEILCTSDWECGIWSECTRNKQSRECIDKNDCPEGTSRPDIRRKCKTTTSGWDMRNVLFDVNIKVLDTNSNGLILGSIGLINVGVPGKVNANLNYKIQNSKKEVIYNESEVILMETQLEFIKEINTSSLPGGEYIWTVELTYEGQTEPAQAQDKFTIGKKTSSSILLIVLAILSSIAIIGVIFFIRKRKNDKELNPQFPKPSTEEKISKKEEEQSETIEEVPPIEEIKSPQRKNIPSE